MDLNEATETARRTGTALEREQVEEAVAAGFKTPASPAADLEEVWALLAPGPHCARIIGSTVDPAFLGALHLHGRRP